ncbi:SemiSWEET family sugar transporter [Pedobacter chitinilyticus]|jgi:MtN3 and saliva related transmembrane protein|uniref:MtN3 and saliva related transmembrane protein n=1 Tax=Pedobacter chitinilyticus TaxID=2233776 RepID=A0A3S3R9A3_9SPHI|nr:SemiSWEET transporter [Pedobacter chitinilyticus]RWU10922.1 hypothetical protein DPV69_06220 [Pedobacter chitinilyticus]
MEQQLIIGILAGSLTAIATTPQIVKVIRTKKVDQVSPLMFVILAAGNATWCWYGILLKDWPIIITNAFSLTMDLAMLVLKAIYHKK